MATVTRYANAGPSPPRATRVPVPPIGKEPSTAPVTGSMRKAGGPAAKAAPISSPLE